ncbi:MAG: ABC transporter substrate-binding protein [Deltaproteobacteria bacterium HGW-Deltaproteobacteria-2]|jgi:NitT/TauT family transport system substrate-binding protein|nr:MAG: ABC transporter substrate-binding protein [Deltaproteobacteria bacterium HGW-Deltaproteobacteria-2]
MIHFQKDLHFAALFLSTLLFIVFTMNGCQPQKQSGPPEKITIAYSTAGNAILINVAFAKDYLREEGLDATPQPHAFGKPALLSVIDGKADIATVGDTPIVFAVMGGKKITTLAVIQTSNRNETIVARRDKGIAKPSDLKGKKIGLTLETTGHFFADAFLQLHNIGRKQVKIVDLKPDEMAHALDTGKVDAVSTWNPTVMQLKNKLGSNGIMFFGESLYTENFCVVAGQEYVKNNPTAIKKVLRALIKAEAFVHEHPEESRRLVVESLKVDKVILDEIWDIFTFRVALDQALLVDFEDQTRWAIKNRLAACRDMPNYLDFIYIDGLLAVKPDAVRIIR